MPKKHILDDVLPNMLTPGEVAELLGVDPKTVTRWSVAGKLKAVRTPGGHRRFSRASVEALLNNTEGEDAE